MMFDVGVFYGVIGCLLLCASDAQDSYYNQAEYYKQYPQYAQSQSGYHGYTTPSGTNSNADMVHVIEVTIPNNGIFSPGSFGITKEDESIISGLIKQYIEPGSSGQAQLGPYTISIEAYKDKKSPSSEYSQTFNYKQPNYSQGSTYQQPNYYQQPNHHHTNYQQQPSSNNDNYYYKQLQHQREVQQYEQKLREYYAKYPSAIPQPATTTSLPHVSQFVNPNEIKPTKHTPLEDGGKSLSELLLGLGKESHTDETPTSTQNNKQSETDEEAGQSLAELLGHSSTAPSTEAPKKSLDDLIGNVFTDKPIVSTAETPTDKPGKSLFELLLELKPADTETSTKPTVSEKDEHQAKKNSDVAGGDYGLDVRTDDSKVKRTKRGILRDGFRRITERITNFGKDMHERHTRDHECKHHEGRTYHSHNHEDEDGSSEFMKNHSKDWHSGRHPYENGGHGHPHPHHNPHPHPHVHPHPNDETYESKKDEERKSNHDENFGSFDEAKKQYSPHDQDIQPSRKPHTASVGTQTEADETINTGSERDPTLEIDVRGGFSDVRRKRHSVKRLKRSPEEEEAFVFQDDDEAKPKDEKTEEGTKEVKAKEEEAKEEEKKEEVAEDGKVTDESATNATETEGEDGEKGDLDSRFGFFGGGGFHRQAGRRPIANLIGGVVNTALGYDPYSRGPPPPGPQTYPYNPNLHGIHPPDYPQQQQFGFGNNYPQPPQQPPIHIHINNVANAQSQASNTAAGPYGPIGSNQNAAANAQSQNVQNQFGSFQNAGASGQASNLAADGSSGQLSAANAMSENYDNQFGAGSKNQAQSQSANFDNHGNLALTSSNSGTNHFAGPDGVRDESNSAAQSSLQGSFGTQNSGAQSNTFSGPHGSGSSASSQSSSFNNGQGYGSQNSGASAAANSGNVGGNSYGNAQSETYANDQWGW